MEYNRIAAHVGARMALRKPIMQKDLISAGIGPATFPDIAPMKRRPLKTAIETSPASSNKTS